jgi:hypothetical protein
VVRDVHRIAGTALAAVTLGYDAHEAFPHQGTMYLLDEPGDIEPFVAAGRDGSRRATSVRAREDAERLDSLPVQDR